MNKKCMQKFSKDNGFEFGWKQTEDLNVALDQKVETKFKDFERNGLYCKSGLAVKLPDQENTARCVQTTSIHFDGEPVDYPYPCKPTDPSKKCQIMYSLDGFENESTEPIQSDCVCALFEDNLGFCESVIGTETYQKAMQAKATVLSQSECHTLDRDDMRAQADSCGIETETEDWAFAVQ